MKKLLTAEYVSPKHPDKICDRISDVILELYIDQDPNSRCAIETMGGHGKIYVLGEVTSTVHITNETIKELIYSIIEGDAMKITISLHQQSPEIANGVDTGGAGDQGIVIGYACNENEEMVPHEYYLAKSLCNYLYEIYPHDGKTQITVDQDFKVTHIVASFQNSKTEDLEKHINIWLQENSIKTSDFTTYFINPAGEWHIGGFDADTGLTGRKIVVDSYGPRVSIGGGAFSGKDWTKVDRSGAQYAKYIAQQLLHKHKAREVRVELAYAIGVSDSIQSVAYIDGMTHNITEFETNMKDIKVFVQNIKK